MEEKKKGTDLIMGSDNFIIIAENGVGIHVKDKATYMSLVTAMLNDNITQGLITKEDLDYMIQIAKMSEKELMEEALEKADSKQEFMNFIKNLLD